MNTAPITSLPFRVIGQYTRVPSDVTGWCGYLNRDKWDDWGKYSTQFYLTLVDPDGEGHSIGNLKIGEAGLKPHINATDVPPGYRRPGVPTRFDELAPNFFSLAQDETYYANLSTLGENVRERVLVSLRDVAFDQIRWEQYRDEYVMTESLLRSITASTVQGQFRRMSQGGARLTKFKFSYTPPKRLGEGTPPFELDFRVDPNTSIPTNIHVLIGRNGVGKTRLLSLMAKSLIAPDASAKQSGKFTLNELDGRGGTFANVVAVTFSAFDEAELLPESKVGPNALGYAYIGLRRQGESAIGPIRPKSPAVLAREFLDSLGNCQIGPRQRRWQTVIANLQSDPVFRAAQLLDLIGKDFRKEVDKDEVLKTFKNLSSGHKIVLLTLTRLVETVEEKTLVLIDEPEAHLHPPLLSAMIRTISALMVDRNGVAIVATHSPVILQEVPKSCVWILNRSVTVSKAERPGIETFAENVGILSREVFQLELVQSGYHQILDSLREREADYDSALAELDDQVGSEGRAVLRAMFLTNDQ
jgi:predicted ATPase